MKYSFIFIFLLMALTGCKDSPNAKPAAGTETGVPDTDPEGVKTEISYQEKGMEYAMATQAALGKALQTKIQEEGIQEAIGFCKVEALPITDSLSGKFGVDISRITDKPRNPVNAANAEEMKFISKIKSELGTGQPPEPLVVRQGDDTNFYYPILTNTMCLKCHGSVEDDIQPRVLGVIAELYPQDQATGYGNNQFRGLWKVSFKKGYTDLKER